MRKSSEDAKEFSHGSSSVHAIADVAKMRPCLNCRQKFESAGFGERICKRCKSTSAWRD